MRHAFNHIINFFWTAIAFYPVVKYWYINGIDHFFIPGISISILISILPKKIYALLQFSNKRSFYEKLGVKTIRRFVQNGEWAKRATAGKDFTLIKNLETAKKYLTTIEMYSRFHWVCFLFFTFSSMHAFFTGRVLAALIILLANILYNCTAILLQQYNKMRIESVLK